MRRRKRKLRRRRRTPNRSVYSAPNIEGTRLRGVLFQWPIIEHFPQNGIPGGNDYYLRPWFAAKVDMQGRIVASRLFWREDHPGSPRNAAIAWLRTGTIPGIVTYDKSPSVQGMD